MQRRKKNKNDNGEMIRATPKTVTSKIKSDNDKNNEKHPYTKTTTKNS